MACAPLLCAALAGIISSLQNFSQNKRLAGTQFLSLDVPWRVCLLCKPRLAAHHLPYCSGCHVVSCVVLYPLSTKLVVMQPFSATLCLENAPLC